MRAFMDDVTTLVESEEGTRRLLRQIDELIDWARMKAKPSKSRSLSIVKGKVKAVQFQLKQDCIPTVKEEPVKSLGRWYSIPLTDRHRGVEVEKKLKEGLQAIDGVDLLGKHKAWCFQFGLLPRILWPLQVYEIALSRVERMEQCVNKFIRKWLGVPPSFSTVGLHSTSTKLQLPTTSLVEDFQKGKARMVLMLHESADPVIRDIQPEIRTGKKWSARAAVDEAEANLRTKEIVGATQHDRAGLGSRPQQWFSQQSQKGRREMILKEMHQMKEEERFAVAAGMAKQGAWTRWEQAEQRKISWQDLARMEPLRISFLLRATYDLLPTPANLKQWKMVESDLCTKCQKRATLEHVLAACPQRLRQYTWRHNQVLKILAEATASQCEAACNQGTTKDQFIPFLQAGEAPVKNKPARKFHASLLGPAPDWRTSCDLDQRLVFPQDIALTGQRPDLVIMSDQRKEVHLVELTVPWEDNLEYAHERKLTRYEDLRITCEERGWRCKVLPVEVGARGFVAHSTIKYLSAIGLQANSRRRVVKDVQTAAETASAWIWQSSSGT